jgi:hypothetical protein
MIFIAGTQPKTWQYRSKTKEHCFHCNNESYWILQKARQYLSLFFLPIASFKTTYFYYCAICGQGRNLEQDEFETKVRNAEPESSKN